MRATDETWAGFELTRLRLTAKGPGIPDVVRSEEAAVGVRVSSITWMAEVVFVSDETDKVTPDEVEIVMALEDRRGPSPPERDIAERDVAARVVSVSSVT